MTISGFNVPACREMRQLLGVYVVGAIDPAERAVVEEHLAECASCRDELAGLASLPAMLSRVPPADVERLSLAPSGLPDMAEPPAELLNSLLRKVSAKRRTRMWRGALAVAASAAIAAGTATLVATQLATPQPASGGSDVAAGVNARTHVAAVVDYTTTPWSSTAMRVGVSGIRPGTACQFWVVGKAGRVYAGSWIVGADYGQKAWYSVSSPVSASSVHSFQITSSGKVLVSIPAS
jgi:predicted anti-sigma-YlaC factor YlaD